MLVMISKQQRPKVEAILKDQIGAGVSFTEFSHNADKFEVSVDQMNELLRALRAEGTNPKEIMFW